MVMMNITILLSAMLLLFPPSQKDVMDNISTALRAGSSKELIKYCNNNIEIKLDGKSSNYSISQAEVVLRDFFLKNPPKGFDYKIDTINFSRE